MMRRGGARRAAAADSALQQPAARRVAVRADAGVQPAGAVSDTGAKLRILAEMRADGILTDAEFAAKASGLVISSE